MKILDRYILRSFLYNYVISFVVLIGMYIVLDMVFNFDDLVSAKGAADISSLQLFYEIGDHYFHQVFLIFVHLSGIIPVVAAAFTLIRLSRFNELSAILAAGVPLIRISAPIIITAVVFQALLMVDQEVLIPNMIPKLTRQHAQLADQATGKSYDIRAMQDDRNAVLFAGRFTPGTENAPAKMLEVDIIERNEDFQPTGQITAERA